MAARSPDGVGVAYKELLMYFPAKHFLDKLQISAQELSDFEQKGIIKGITKAGRVFYSSRDLYRLKGILVLMTRGLTLERAQRRLDHPVEETSGTESRR